MPWHRTLAAISAALFVTMSGMSACIPFLPLFVRELGVSDLVEAQRWSGLAHSAPFFLAVIATPLWGAIGDRYGRKLMVMRALVALTVFNLLIANVETVTELVVLRAIQGGLSGFVASSMALVAASAPASRSGFAISIVQAAMSSGMVIGPLFGGILADRIGVRSVFFVIAALCFTSFVLVWAAVKEGGRPAAPREEREAAPNAWSVLFGNPAGRKIMLAILLAQAGLTFAIPIYPFYLEMLGAPHARIATYTGVLFGITGIFTALVATRWGRRTDRLGFERTIALTLPLAAAAIAAQGFVHHFTHLFPIRVLVGVATGGIMSALYTGLSNLAPAQMKGRAMGFASSAHLLGNLTGPLACGYIAGVAGMRTCFVIAALLPAGVYLMFSFRSVIASEAKQSLTWDPRKNASHEG